MEEEGGMVAVGKKREKKRVIGLDGLRLLYLLLPR